MAKAELKTRPTGEDVAAYLASGSDPRRRDEAELMDRLHRRVTGYRPQMWGPSIIGYDSYHYKYASGREGDYFRAGFSPRKAAMTICLMGNYCDRQAEADALFDRLGKHRTGKSCLYITRLENVDLDVLEQLIRLSWDIMNRTYPD